MKVRIDGLDVYFDHLDQVDPSAQTHDAYGLNRPMEWSAEKLGDALRPMAKVINSLRNSTQDISPDEMEISMQFEIAVSGETPVLKIVSAETTCQIAAKFVWKKEQ